MGEGTQKPENPEVVDGIDYTELAQLFSNEAVETFVKIMRTGTPNERLKAAREIISIARDARTLVLTPGEALRIAETRAQISGERRGIEDRGGSISPTEGLSRVALLPSTSHP